MRDITRKLAPPRRLQRLFGKLSSKKSETGSFANSLLADRLTGVLDLPIFDLKDSAIGQCRHNDR